ncbi:MAG: 50S ribosomal protein L13 [Spirochaetia bacterium]|nr:50S ribosomal protein L13 [Spirochaetia bacterium]
MSNLLPSQRTYFANPSTLKKEWILIDARDQVLGRLAARIAHRARGKHRVDYAPHMDVGDNVVVINARHIKVSGKKLEQKYYYEHSHYPGGLKETKLKTKMEKDPIYAEQNKAK